MKIALPATLFDEESIEINTSNPYVMIITAQEVSQEDIKPNMPFMFPTGPPEPEPGPDTSYIPAPNF